MLLNNLACGVERGRTLVGDLTQSCPLLSIPRQMAAISSPSALQVVRASIDAWTKGGGVYPGFLTVQLWHLHFYPS